MAPAYPRDPGPLARPLRTAAGHTAAAAAAVATDAREAAATPRRQAAMHESGL